MDSPLVLLDPAAEAGPHDELFQELYDEHLEDMGLDAGDEARFEDE